MNKIIVLVFLIFTTTYTNKTACMLSKEIRPLEKTKQTEISSLQHNTEPPKQELSNANSIEHCPLILVSSKPYSPQRWLIELQLKMQLQEKGIYTEFDLQNCIEPKSCIYERMLKCHGNWITDAAELDSQEEK